MRRSGGGGRTVARLHRQGVAVGTCASLRRSDQVNGSHRGHHVFLAKSLAYLAARYDPKAEISAEVEGLLQRALAEIAGLAAADKAALFKTL